MKMIIGLGNPGPEYDGTRHNIGFAVLEKLRSAWEFTPFEKNTRFNAEISKGSAVGQEIILAMPQTFMNHSGEAVQSLVAFYKLTPADIMVIHDDLDIGIGRYKIATDSSSAGHNGVQDIIDKLGTQKFKRVRVGIGEETPTGAVACRLNAHEFVLAKFSEVERKKIYPVLSQIVETEIPKLLPETK